MTGMISVELVCVFAGLVIMPLVSLFKRVDFVENHTKVVVAIFSAITAGLSTVVLDVSGWQGIVACTLIPFSTAVSAYEVQKSATNDTKAAG